MILTYLISGLLLFLSCSDAGTPITDPDPPTQSDQYFPVPVNASDIIESEDQNFRTDIVLEGLSVPWGMAFLPDGRVLITERSGNLRVVKDGKLVSQSITGVPQVQAQGQGGLLDVQIHPDFEENGWIYFSYSRAGSGGAHTAVMRAKLDDMQLTDQELIFQAEPFTSAGVHFGSRIVFDDDGYLFISTGDRGQMNNAQNLGNHSGKVIRLHDDGTIPSDNPFVNEPGAKPEIFTYGNRNIQGLVIHPETGEVWSHEHGPRGGDEINVMRSGNNYGWPEITYGINYNGTIITDETEREGMEQPVLHWTPSIAPSGMAFVFGDRYPGWNGDVMSGALSLRFLNRTVLDGETVVKEERLLENIGRVRNVVLAPDGYLYIAVESTGRIIRLLPE
jgi:glucose/arabinose dehydrogenase